MTRDHEFNYNVFAHLSQQEFVDPCNAMLPGAVPQVGHFILQPDLEVPGGELVPALLGQESQGDGAVHASGYEDGDLHGSAPMAIGEVEWPIFAAM